MSVADWRDRFNRYDPRRGMHYAPGSGDAETPYGFRWGPFEVARWMSARRSAARQPIRLLGLVTDAGHELQVSVSGRGRVVRVWLDHRELKVPEEDGRVKCDPDSWICSVCGEGHILFRGFWKHVCLGQMPERGGRAEAE